MAKKNPNLKFQRNFQQISVLLVVLIVVSLQVVYFQMALVCFSVNNIKNKWLIGAEGN